MIPIPSGVTSASGPNIGAIQHAFKMSHVAKPALTVNTPRPVIDLAPGGGGGGGGGSLRFKRVPTAKQLLRMEAMSTKM